MLVRIGLAGACAANVMAIAFALYGGMLDGMEPEFAALFRWASFFVALPAVIWGGGVFVKGAWSGLRAGMLGMDLPISLGLLAGFLHGAVNTARGGGDVYFDSLTTLIFLLLVGRYLQRRQQRAAADATELVAALAPSRARLLEGDVAHEVPLEALLPGAVVEVRAGDAGPRGRRRALRPIVARRVASLGRITAGCGAGWGPSPRRNAQSLVASHRAGRVHGRGHAHRAPDEAGRGARAPARARLSSSPIGSPDTSSPSCSFLLPRRSPSGSGSIPPARSITRWPSSS